MYDYTIPLMRPNVRGYTAPVSGSRDLERLALTQCGLVTPSGVIDRGLHMFRKGLVVFTLPSHYLTNDDSLSILHHQEQTWVKFQIKYESYTQKNALKIASAIWRRFCAGLNLERATKCDENGIETQAGRPTSGTNPASARLHEGQCRQIQTWFILGTLSTILIRCERDFLHKGPVVRSLAVFSYVNPNKLSSCPSQRASNRGGDLNELSVLKRKQHRCVENIISCFGDKWPLYIESSLFSVTYLGL